MKTFRGGVLVALCFASLASVAAPLKVAPGTVVVYSDGDVEKLLSRTSDSSIWEDARKRRYERSEIGFFGDRRETRFPPGSRVTEWQTDERELARLVKSAPGTMLPFTVRRDRDGTVSYRSWRCTYNGMRDVEVLTETLQAQDVSCKRFNRKHQVKETRETFYVPALGLVVWQSISRPGRTTQERSVQAILSPAEATADAISAIVKRLN